MRWLFSQWPGVSEMCSDIFVCTHTLFLFSQPSFSQLFQVGPDFPKGKLSQWSRFLTSYMYPNNNVKLLTADCRRELKTPFLSTKSYHFLSTMNWEKLSFLVHHAASFASFQIPHPFLGLSIVFEDTPTTKVGVSSLRQVCRPVFATRCAWAILLISFRWSVTTRRAQDDTLFITRRDVCQRRGVGIALICGSADPQINKC